MSNPGAFCSLFKIEVRLGEETKKKKVDLSSASANISPILPKAANDKNFLRICKLNFERKVKKIAQKHKYFFKRI